MRDAACSVENRVSLVVMRCANVYRAKRRCPLQYRITVCRTSFISLKTTNQEMPSSESGLTLSLLPYAVGAGEHGSPGVVATVPLRPLCRRYSGIRRKWQSVRWLSRRRGGRHREEENSNQAEDGIKFRKHFAQVIRRGFVHPRQRARQLPLFRLSRKSLIRSG